MEVKMISKECIKPLSPTPHHLKNHKLSLLDLYLPPIYVPIILYYPVNKDSANYSDSCMYHIVSKKLQLLKQSLSETLSSFYPFAGKIKGPLCIDCNDEGIYFVEALVRSTLNEFLSHPNNSLITKFLSDDAEWLRTLNVAGSHVAGVQVTTFACGGIAVGAFVSHMIADGTTFSWFLKSWAATACKNVQEVLRPKFDSLSLFPRTDEYPEGVGSSAVFTSHIIFDRYLTRRFVFDATAIANIKTKATSPGVQNPTRVEAVTALLSKCIIKALKAKSSSDDKSILLNHAVNLRRKITPSFSEYYRGNFVWLSSALCKDKEAELSGLVSQIRESIAKLDGDFVNSLQGDKGWLHFLEAFKYENETCTSAADNIVFTSWCNLGFYDIDFGWGKPAWAGVYGLDGPSYSHNLVVLMDTKLGNGIEAWVFLREKDMARLQVDKELLEFATVDPSPLKQVNPVSIN